MARMLDSNVLLDIVTADAKWLHWSSEQFRQAASEGPILINPIIYAEIAPAFDSQAALDRWLRPTLFQRLRLPYEAGYRAAGLFSRIGNAAVQRLRHCRISILARTPKSKA